MLPNLIVPVLNRYDLLQRMLDSVDHPIRHLVLIDNGDAMDKLRFPRSVTNVHYIPLPGNLGVAGSWNLGIKVLPHHEKWIIGSNDVVFAPGDLAKFEQASVDEVTVCDKPPHWQVFCVGENVVRDVGLFDEALYPAYFEDNDYVRRVQHHGFTIRQLPLGVHHDNSSTLRANRSFAERNSATFASNRKYLQEKQANFDFGPGSWDLTRRRQNDWNR